MLRVDIVGPLRLIGPRLLGFHPGLDMPSKLIKLGNVILVRGDMSGENKEVRRYHKRTEGRNGKLMGGIKRARLSC